MKKINIPLQYPVEMNEKILGGTPVIKGTRVPASLVFELLKRGYSVELMNKEYPSLTINKLNAFLTLLGNSFDDQTAQAI